jgi:hypothetical protein
MHNLRYSTTCRAVTIAGRKSPRTSPPHPCSLVMHCMFVSVCVYIYTCAGDCAPGALCVTGARVCVAAMWFAAPAMCVKSCVRAQLEEAIVMATAVGQEDDIVARPDLVIALTLKVRNYGFETASRMCVVA